ncbi:uncharacterized protein LOC135351726 isoform X3 [Halichondria panicea]|uniref:uncharacterized protein LOC135351726 isoform X3 n=1 Tax=Halichondria panicea TaxID=6063 RepID=UPI00312BBDA1
MACPVPCYNSYVSAVTKKPSKDNPRWPSDTHAHTPSQDHAHSISAAGPRSDGGWSTGLPAKGSGWRKSNPESSNEWGQSTWEDGAGGWAEGEGRGNKTETDGWGHNGQSEGGWASDDGSSRSQSPGGIVMVVKQTTPSKENSGPWESRTTGANWKMHTLDTKPVDESEKIREKVSWNKQESCETDSATRKETVTEGHNDTNVSSTASKMPYSREDSSPTKAQTNMSGTSTPTQELAGVWRSGRTSANSVSSRSASPRKMNRGYEQTTSTNSTNSLGRSSAGAGLILPRPRKTLAELEGGLESLHSAPSGWGQLPSPTRTDDTDKGTEYWGIPPDDMVRMTGSEQPPIINGWNGGSHSPHPKSGEYPADSANWSSNENAGKAGWAEEKLPHPEPSNSSWKMTPSASEPHLSHSHSGGLDMPTTTHTEPGGYTIKTKWNSFDDTKEPAAFQPVYPNAQSQIIQNNIMVKDLLLRSQAVAKLQMGQPSGNIQSIQKCLSQQLNQAQMVRQKLISQAPPTGISTLPPQHPLKVQLGRTNDIISQLKQQVLSQHNSSMFNPRMKQQSHTHFSEGNGDLTYGLRDMSISQRSHGTTQQPRSMSKLQRFIPSQEDGTDNMYGGNLPPSSGYSSTSPFSPPFRSSSTNSMMSPSLGPKPVHQIQEFRPGVPWQPPRKNDGLSKHTEQYYGSPGPQRTMSQSTSSYGQQPQSRFGGQQQHKFSRSLSTDTNYYGNQGHPSVRGDHPWSNTAVDPRPQTYNAGRGWNGPQRPGRISLPSTPVSSLEHGGWRQQPPPSTLLPNQYTSRRGSRTPMDTHSEWIPETPTSADPVWGVDGGAWPKSGGGRGGWSQPETPSSDRAWPEGVFSEWQAGGKKMGGAALSPWLVIRTNSPQLNIQSLKDTCKGFGDIKSFIEGPEFVLVGYGSVEETLQAKSHIDGLWGGKTSTEVVADGEMEKLWQQINEPPKPRPPSSLLSDGARPGVFKWEDTKQAPPHSYSRQASTPGGSSVWSDGGFLSGISSPWSSEFSGTLASPSTGYQSDDIPSAMTTPDDRSQGNSVLSPFLPNGLL